MTDKDLLEAAAKAAGITLGFDARGPYEVVYGISGNCQTWNPLTDDGDALRLAVTTGILQGRGFDNAWTAMYAVGKLPKDKFEATRRAIVRAAAEIGRKK